MELGDPSYLLEDLVGKVPGTHSALLLSTDGLRISSVRLDDADADTLSALASGVCSMAQGLGKRFSPAQDDGLRQVFIELKGLVMFITAPAERTVLAVLADPRVDAKSLSYQMGRFETQLRDHLETPARNAPTQLGNR